jgi:hypothetical protein
MKKYLPIILFLVGVLVLVGVFFLIKNRKTSTSETEEVVTEVPLEKRPVTSLTPSEDGHWLKLKIDKISLGAASLDYELLYKLPDGRTQGVPGTVSLSGKKSFERDLLLGSESSGKFRYDEGVKQGTLTLRFRNEKGKLLGKLATDFHLLNKVTELSSVDGKFKFTLNKKPSQGYFVVMETFGLPEKLASSVSGPYGVFSSAKEALPGIVGLEGQKIYGWSGSKWNELSSGKATNIGIFVSTSE